MAKRSLQATPTGIRKAKQAFNRKGWTQENLAGEINIKTRQPIWRFLTGQPVDRYIFLEICTILDLDHREIATHAPHEFVDAYDDTESSPPAISGIEALVQEVRSQRFDKIQDQCGILHMPDINRLVSLDQVYVDANILEEISSQQPLAIADLQTDLQKIDYKKFNQQSDKFSLAAIEQPLCLGMRAVEKHRKVRVLGQPGAGKTTFLQHLAVQCNHSQFEGQIVPIFITVKNFVEESKSSQGLSLLNYIRQEFVDCGISDLSAIETLLKAGRVLLLLDGMDEVLNQDSSTILNEIRKFSETYHKNRFVASCRIASANLSLRGFIDIEVAPFSQAQIADFVQKWFEAFTAGDTEFQNIKSAQFIEKLNEHVNLPFCRLVSTPLFLHLACRVFYEQGSFSNNYSELYKESLDLLLGRWDEARGVKRDQIFDGFSIPQKLKLLSQLAAATFERGQYVFTHAVIEQNISDYLSALTNASTDPEEIQHQSLEVLKALEYHGLLSERSRGVFSFSYLAFHQYFTARKIVASYNLQASNQPLEELVSHLVDPEWREVFLLTTAMLPNADRLLQLIKQKIDHMVDDSYIQEFLNCQADYLCSLGKIRIATFNHFPTDSEWDFSCDQEQVLHCYCEASQLLLDCLNSNNEMAVVIRQEMKVCRLLPFKEYTYTHSISA
jgi:predicted NACHT family NTPase